ncbi:42355_t:CDS:2, partial [Gigaspora margarita]
DGQKEEFLSATVISTMEAGTECHAYVTDCKAKKLFDGGMKICNNCTVTKRDNIPGNMYCLHMIIHAKDGNVCKKAIPKNTKSGCFTVSEQSGNFTYEATSCPEQIPVSCSVA